MLGATYHVPWGLRLTGALDAAALRRALDRIVARHETLRTTFPVADDGTRQVIQPAASESVRCDGAGSDGFRPAWGGGCGVAAARPLTAAEVAGAVRCWRRGRCCAGSGWSGWERTEHTCCC